MDFNVQAKPLATPKRGRQAMYTNPNHGQDYNAWREEKHTEGAVFDAAPLQDLYEMSKAGWGTRGRSGQGVLQEALSNDPQAQNLLRDGLRYHVFQGFARMPSKASMVTQFFPSNKPEEYHLNDGAYGTLPKVPSGSETPNMVRSQESRVRIQNDRYAGIQPITGDEIRFDSIGQIQQTAMLMGGAARSTIDAETFRVITTAANYTKTMAAGYNDVGAHTGVLNLSADNFVTAYTTLSTMKDPETGQYLGCNPDMLVCAPRVEFAARQLFMSPSLSRVGANANETYGTGEMNVFGMINKIVVSPYMGDDFQWALADSMNNGLLYQEVMPVQVQTESRGMTSESWLLYDIMRYMVSCYFGVGFQDSRSWTYQAATSAPTVT